MYLVIFFLLGRTNSILRTFLGGTFRKKHPVESYKPRKDYFATNAKDRASVHNFWSIVNCVGDKVPRESTSYEGKFFLLALI